MHTCSRTNTHAHAHTGVLGPGQEARATQALSFRQLAHLLLQVHQGNTLAHLSLEHTNQGNTQLYSPGTAF